MPFSSGPADVQSLVAMQQNTSLSEEITIPSIALQGVVHSYGTGARLPSLYTTALSEAGVRSIWEGPADLTLGLDLSPTGDFLVSSLNGRLYVVESFSGREIVRGQPIAFSNDKTRLAFFTPKTGVALLNIASRKLSTKLKLLHPFEPSQPKPSQCAENGTFSPYDHHLAWRCDDGRSLVIWDIATGTIANEIRSATDQLAWKFHPLTRQLLFCSTDHWSNSPQRWTAEQNVLVLSWYDKDTMGYVGSMLLRPKGFDFLQLPQLLFSADGEHLGITFATDLGSKLKVFNLDGDAVCEIQSHKRFSHIQACPSGTFRLTYEGDEPDVLSIMVKRIEKMKTQTWFWQRDNDWYGVTDTHGRKPALINQRTGKSIALPFFAHRSWFRRKQLMKEGKVVAWSRDGTVIAMQYDIREEESGQGRMIAIWKLAMHTKAR
ncbi:hypothetical protein MMC25_006627 [Agyrium rufum]|nr:hypothetical protein [Agyrium rufum]